MRANLKLTQIQSTRFAPKRLAVFHSRTRLLYHLLRTKCSEILINQLQTRRKSGEVRLGQDITPSYTRNLLLGKSVVAPLYRRSPTGNRTGGERTPGEPTFRKEMKRLRFSFRFYFQSPPVRPPPVRWVMLVLSADEHIHPWLG